MHHTDATLWLRHNQSAIPVSGVARFLLSVLDGRVPAREYGGNSAFFPHTGLLKETTVLDPDTGRIRAGTAWDHEQVSRLLEQWYRPQITDAGL